MSEELTRKETRFIKHLDLLQLSIEELCNESPDNCITLILFLQGIQKDLASSLQAYFSMIEAKREAGVMAAIETQFIQGEERLQKLAKAAFSIKEVFISPKDVN